MTHSNTIDIPSIPANTIWLTGISGAGKSSLAEWMKRKYFHDYIIIDGDELRQGVCKDLGFSQEDRKANVERAAHLCRMLNKQGHKVIACMMSPLEEHRKAAREIVGNSMFMVYVACSLDEVKKRDPKGLYKKFANGEIKGMSGLDAPFEVPVNVEAVVNTEFLSLEDCLSMIVNAHLKFVSDRYKQLSNSIK